MTQGNRAAQAVKQYSIQALMAPVGFPKSGQRSAFPAWGKVRADGDRMAGDECGGIPGPGAGVADGTECALYCRLINILKYNPNIV